MRLENAELNAPNADITPEELHRRRTNGESVLVIDVRNPDELLICRLEGTTPIPLNELPMRMAELDPDIETVMQCRSGARSAQAAAFLRANGFTNVRNLAGGILAWIDKVDPTLTKY